MPPKGRIKHASQHDKRHDTGLAAPGKRISSKDKATAGGSISVNGRAAHSQSPSPHTSAGLSRGQGELDTSESDSNGQGGHNHSNGGNKFLGQGVDANTGHGSGPRDAHASHHGHVDDHEHDCACPKDNSALKTAASHAVSSLSLAATILSACPLRDAIAILILFLSLPPTLIIVIHSLFASLTFVPPAAAFSWGSGTSLPTFADWFHATPGGGPSPFTILVSDIVMTLIYLLCPLHLQNIFMDLGQAVIAISLSGAAAGAGSSTRSVAVCSTIILVSHIFRYKHSSITQLLSTVLQAVGMDLPQLHASHPDVSAAHPNVYGWPRLLLGCHLLAQGLLTLLRRWFAGAAQDRHVSKLEVEQASLADSGQLAMLHLDGNEMGPGGGTDGRPPGPNSIAREPKERISNTKKKRKQANQARSQQPLWAAIASTKVTFMKELEHKQLSYDAAEASNGRPKDDASSSVMTLNDRIWIQDIAPTQVRFQADLALTILEDSSISSTAESAATSSVDWKAPFFVRLNGADWGSTQIVSASGDDRSLVSGKDCVQWTGEIHGLSPRTRYTCELVRTRDKKVICRTTLVTTPIVNAEKASVMPAIVPNEPLRPMSPTSTLKQSIAAADAKHEEARNRLKRNRKDHKTAASAIRREIDQLQSKVASSGGQDERSRQRILQLKQHVKQAEDATQALRDESEALGEIPQADLDQAAACRKTLETAQAAKKAATTAYDESRTNANKEITSLKDQLASSVQKKERLGGRKAKLSEAIERLKQEQTASVSARQQYEHERALKREEQAKQIEQIVYWTEATRSEAEGYNSRAGEMLSSIQALGGNMHLSHAQQQQVAPPTPEGNLPGTNGPLVPSTKPFEFVPFGGAMPMQQQSAPMQQQPWNLAGGRQRSSSMLSGYSGFTDEHMDFEDNHKLSNGYSQGRKTSDGSGSKGNSSSSTGSAVGGAVEQHNGGGAAHWAHAPAFNSAAPTPPTMASPGGPVPVKPS